ncbi:MAG: metal-dependent transcriptional regulator [Erysipelotrichaceae bacterium]|nr:metal-dependent transcriptional regulator [Erysipelotrichaceae bacterium]MBR5754851.1 metal-dependent transcriptional regulator [Erysipelotrichaceae bacterium]
MKKEETIQNYLEAIYIISRKRENVRAIDIVNYLDFSRPTVSIALKELEKDGYLIFDDKYVVLTEKGREVASTMYERHEYIAKILMKLGVDEKTAYEDSCLIEHDISKETFDAIKKSTEHMFK